MNPQLTVHRLWAHSYKFENMNYMLWQLKRETMLKVKELWGLIDNIELKLDKVDIIVTATFVKKES
jgi:hypothetical protein